MFKKITLMLMVCNLYAQSITVGEEYKNEELFGPFKLGKASLKTEKIEIILILTYIARCPGKILSSKM